MESETPLLGNAYVSVPGNDGGSSGRINKRALVVAGRTGDDRQTLFLMRAAGHEDAGTMNGK